MLVVAIAIAMQEQRREMSARQYLSLAMRLFPDEAREELFVMLLKLDGDPNIPYPMRNVHHLSPYPKDGRTARGRPRRSVTFGCWGPAARAFARIAEQEPQNAALWQNVGLCRAWDGDEAGAAEAFHRAAGSSDDSSSPSNARLWASCSTKTTADSLPLREVHFPIRSASQAASACWRVTTGSSCVPRPKAEEEGQLDVAGEFMVRNKPLPERSRSGPTLCRRISLHRGDAHRFRRATPQMAVGAAAAYLRGYAGEAFDSALRVGGEPVRETRLPAPPSPEIDESAEPVPAEHSLFLRLAASRRRLPRPSATR